jgi:5'-methylthioadenosine phosphorylase
MTIQTAFITGTGFYSLPGVTNVRPQAVTTPFGEVGVEIADFNGQEIAFIPRHGKRHTIAPAKINYRGNLFALKMLGAERVLATNVSGSLVRAWGPGTMILIDQFINFTYERPQSFYPMDGKLAHVDVTDPYCSTLHKQLLTAAHDLDTDLQLGCTYACFDGPRFETRAEIEMVRRLGGQLVGQTSYPECVLARELAMCFATVGIVSNWAAGMQEKVTGTEVSDNLVGIGDKVSNLFAKVLTMNPQAPDCACRHALDEAFLKV